MTDEPSGKPLFDRAYVETCVEKAIERFADDYKYDGDNTYYHVEKDSGYDEVVSVEPACLVGQILADIGVDETMQTQIAMFHNSQAIRDLAKIVDLPIDEPALEFLDQVQRLNDVAVPWHRILEELPAT